MFKERHGQASLDRAGSGRVIAVIDNMVENNYFLFYTSYV